jgi:hypothetical protein
VLLSSFVSISATPTFLFVTLNFVWALRAGERSSRVKIADRGFASRQGASLVPIERGNLRNFFL